jgi:hypothetical protein
MTKDAIITLSIKVAGTPPQSTFLFHVMVDGNVIASNQSLSPEESKAVREISRRYNALFEGRMRAKIGRREADRPRRRAFRPLDGPWAITSPEILFTLL